MDRGSENKVPFVAKVEMHYTRPHRNRFDPVSAFSYAELTAWARKALFLVPQSHLKDCSDPRC